MVRLSKSHVKPGDTLIYFQVIKPKKKPKNNWTMVTLCKNNQEESNYVKVTKGSQIMQKQPRDHKFFQNSDQVWQHCIHQLRKQCSRSRACLGVVEAIPYKEPCLPGCSRRSPWGGACPSPSCLPSSTRVSSAPPSSRCCCTNSNHLLTNLKLNQSPNSNGNENISKALKALAREGT